MPGSRACRLGLASPPSRVLGPYPAPTLTACLASLCARRLGRNIIADAPGDLPCCLQFPLRHQAALCASGQEKSAPGPRGHSLASVYKPPLWREKKKNTFCPPPLTSPPLAAPSHCCCRRRRRRGCRPGAHRRGIFAPRHCAERERDGGEITARRDPCGGDTNVPDGAPHAGREMPPPALKGAHKAALPRARCAPGARQCGLRPAGRGRSSTLHLVVVGGGGKEATPRRLQCK